MHFIPGPVQVPCEEVMKLRISPKKRLRLKKEDADQRDSSSRTGRKGARRAFTRSGLIVIPAAPDSEIGYIRGIAAKQSGQPPLPIREGLSNLLTPERLNLATGRRRRP